MEKREIRRENPIENIYKEREKFIIIGLTGRTGSGCTTISNILSTESFKDLTLKQPKKTNFSCNSERKYQIIYNYAEEHWSPFFRISMTDIIFSFILQHTYKEFIGILKEVIGKELTNKVEKNIRNCYGALTDEFIYLNKKSVMLLLTIII